MKIAVMAIQTVPLVCVISRVVVQVTQEVVIMIGKKLRQHATLAEMVTVVPAVLIEFVGLKVPGTMRRSLMVVVPALR